MRKRRLSRFQLDTLVVIEINKIEISDHGQIDDPFVCMDIRNICYPFLVGIICVKVSIEKILILVHLLPLLVPVYYHVLYLCPHFLSVNRRKSRSNSFSIFNRLIS